MTFVKLRSDDRGAAAIEYAVIAGLIGLGIVGSLVTTRTSLRSVFGTASSQMDSAASPAASPAATAPAVNGQVDRTAFWQGKTVTNTVTNRQGGVTTTSYEYSDGTVVRYERLPTENRLYTQTNATNTINYVYSDANNIQTLFEIDKYDGPSFSGTRTSTFSTAGDYPAGSGTPTTMTTQTAASGQSPVTTRGLTPTAGFIETSQIGSGDLTYFRKISP